MPPRKSYNWRWNRTPIYFAYQDDIDITSDSTAKWRPSKRTAARSSFTVKGIGEEEKYTAPAAGLRVSEGEFISPGDTLASYKKWKPDCW
jgi:hypothetical protein